MKRVMVVYERGGVGWWTASVPSVPGALTQGRTVDEARRNIRDALGTFPENGWAEKDAATAAIEDDIRLPKSARVAITTALLRRKEAARAEAAAKEAALDAARALAGDPLRLSTRDAAAFLGLSQQRVSQLLDEAKGSTRRPRFGAPRRGDSRSVEVTHTSPVENKNGMLERDVRRATATIDRRMGSRRKKPKRRSRPG